MANLATLEELSARLDWILDADETRDAEGALEYLSDLVRHYGKPWADPVTAPRLVKNLVINAAKRYLRNPDGYTQSRAGDETLNWNEVGDKAGAPFLTETEIKMLTGFSGKSGFYSAPLTAWNGRLRSGPGYVPVAGGGDPFPLFTDTIEPW